LAYPPEGSETRAGRPAPTGPAAGRDPEGTAAGPGPQTAPAAEARGVSRPLALLMLAAMVVGLLAAVGQYQAWQRPVVPEPARPARRDGLIMAGQRVDFITLNLPVEQVEWMLGPGRIRPERTSQLYIFEKVGLSLSVQKGLVRSILVKTPDLRTADGLSVGSDVDRVVRLFGPDYDKETRTPQDYSLHYWARGIHFAVEGTRVVSILVAEPAHGPEPFTGP